MYTEPPLALTDVSWRGSSSLSPVVHNSKVSLHLSVRAFAVLYAESRRVTCALSELFCGEVRKHHVDRGICSARCG